MERHWQLAVSCGHTERMLTVLQCSIFVSRVNLLTPRMSALYTLLFNLQLFECFIFNLMLMSLYHVSVQSGIGNTVKTPCGHKGLMYSRIIVDFINCLCLFHLSPASFSCCLYFSFLFTSPLSFPLRIGPLHSRPDS